MKRQASGAVWPLAPKLRLALLVLGLPLGGCPGTLIWPPGSGIGEPCETSAECGKGQVCEDEKCALSDGPCATTDGGDCELGFECHGNVCVCVLDEHCEVSACVTAGGCTFCNEFDCPPGQACNYDTLACEDIPTDECGPTNPDGLCEDGVCCENGATCCSGGDTCVGDHCVPIPSGNECSPSEPDGWCGDGLCCDDGACKICDSCACSATNTDGCCPDGQRCVGGACDDADCSPSHLGSCELDFVCEDGTCQQLDCAPGHTSGRCADEADYCSSCGTCIDDTACCDNPDCTTFGTFCSVGTEVCQLNGTCFHDDDCALRQDPPFGQGYRCDLGINTCVERTSCTQDGECLPTKYCSPLGTCRELPDCDPPPVGVADRCPVTQKCSKVVFDCIPEDECRGPVDCSDNEHCSSQDKCLPELQCLEAEDCGLGFTCQGAAGETPGTCVVDVPCANNLVNVQACGVEPANYCDNGAAPGAAACCEPGLHCSAEGACIPMGKCTTNDECLASHFACVSGACVPIEPCSSCDSGTEECTTVRDADDNPVTGCVPKDRCATDNDCRAGERCNAEFYCECNDTCGDETLGVATAVAPRVLITLDRSGSMNLCGAGDPLFGHCGYNYGKCGTCTGGDNAGNACSVGADCPGVGGGTCGASAPTDTRCNGFDALATLPYGESGNGNIECANFGSTGGRLCSDAQCIVGCDDSSPLSGACTQLATTPRWEQALEALMGLGPDGVPLNGDDTQGLLDKFIGRVAFGLSLYPHATGNENCTQDCRSTSCTDAGGGIGLDPGVVDVPVGVNTLSLIEDKLVNVTGSILNAHRLNPFGATPTAHTLRAILGLNDRGGLNSENSANAVLLVTDGEPTASSNANEPPIATCVAPCGNGVKDALETGVDCGGHCRGCADGAACNSADDCASGVCQEGICRDEVCASTCGSLNSCAGCGDGGGCDADADCQSKVCDLTAPQVDPDFDGTCAAPACDDGEKNGVEGGIDCGGPCPTGCADGAACVDAGDCSSGFCDTATDVCRPLHCGSAGAVPDGDETDVDCGGSCKPCANGLKCGTNDDASCQSGICDQTANPDVCIADQCQDGVKNGAETDIDCGGGTCADCLPGFACATSYACVGAPNNGAACDDAADCAPGVCTPTVDDNSCAGNVGGGCVACSTAQSCKVNAAIDKLYSQEPHIKTFVIGFQLSGSANLNCNAIHGKTAKDVGACRTTQPANCASVPDTCYHVANNTAALQTALDDVISKVATCRYPLDEVPEDSTQVFVYLQDQDAPDVLNRLVSPGDYSYDSVRNEVVLTPVTCAEASSPSDPKTPIVVFGCSVINPGG